jgi:2-polyprenyl-3-methyl-5-hydroxy-6-metoxy-1,4-benzoquinol methylase
VVSQLVCRIEQRTGAMAGKRVLDFGCGIGTMSRLLLATGAQRVDAIETDPGARAAVQRELGIQVAPNIDELRRQTPPPTYDLVTMIEVVEHVRSPVETLSAIRSLVKPGGALIVETPDAESLKARLARSNWENYRNPTHLFYFTLASLQRALHLAGFARSYVWRPIIEYPAHSAPRRLVQFSLQRLGLDGALRVVAYA